MLFWLLETTCTVCRSTTQKLNVSVLLWGRTLHGRSVCIHVLNYRHHFFFKPPTRHGKSIDSDDIPALKAWLQMKIPSVWVYCTATISHCVMHIETLQCYRWCMMFCYICYRYFTCMDCLLLHLELCVLKRESYCMASRPATSHHIIPKHVPLPTPG